MALRKLALVSIAALAASQAAHAQVTTITPDTAAGVTLGTTVTQGGSTYTIDGGTLAGGNLFHSFSQFDLGTGDVAQWVHTGGDAASINNVINRVTGGTASSIFGMLDSTAIPNADFYFINPAGIVFGSGAEVNVPAAAHFSTASDLHFADGGTLSIATPSGSTLSVAAPEAFGFIGNEAALALTDGSGIAAAGALSLSAPDILIDSSWLAGNGVAVTALGAVAGDVWLDGSASVAPQGSLAVSNAYVVTQRDFETDYRPISFSAAQIDIDGSTLESIATFGGTGPGGYIMLDASSWISVRNSFVHADTYGSDAAGLVWMNAGDLISIVDSSVFSDTYSSGFAGAVLLYAPDIYLGGAYVTAESLDAGGGGYVDIQAQRSLVISDSILSAAGAGGDAGVVNLSGSDVWIDSSRITAQAPDGADLFGGVQIQSTAADGDGIVSIIGTGVDAENGYISVYAAGELSVASTLLTAQNGFIDLVALGGDLILDGAFVQADGGYLSAVSSSGSVFVGGTVLTSDGGFVQLLANEGGISVDGSLFTADGGFLSVESATGTSIASTSLTADDGYIALYSQSGDVSLDGVTATADDGYVDIFGASSVSIVDSTISADNFSGLLGTNAAGIFIASDGDVVFHNSSVSLDAFTDGPAGALFVVGNSVSLTDSFITLDSFGGGDAGLISISANDLLMDFSYLSSDTLGAGRAGSISLDIANSLTMIDAVISTQTSASGDSGDITISASSMSISGSNITTDAYDDFVVTAGSGDAGVVDIDVSGAFALETSWISSDAVGEGNAGGVFVTAGSMSITDAFITSDSYESGNGGLVQIITDGALSLSDGSWVSSDALGDGDAGGVVVQAGSMNISGGSFITSDASEEGDGNGGSVDVSVAGALTIDSGGRISTNVAGAGDAGDVTVDAASIALTGGSQILSNSDFGSTGNAGNVSVSAPAITISGGSSITSDAEGEGNAGSVVVGAASLQLEDALLSSSTLGAGDAGGVFLLGGDVSMVRSLIRSDALSEGDAGGVVMRVNDLSMTDSVISSEAASTGLGGLIFLDATGTLSLFHSAIATNASGTGDAGDIDLSARAVTLESGSSISSDAQSPEGGNSGFVTVSADELLMSGASRISTGAANQNAAGFISLHVGTLTMEGQDTAISSENTSADAGDAGSIAIEAGDVTIAEGARITTNSANGAAGDIDLAIAEGGLLKLIGVDQPGVIETSSGPGTGGIISIASPLAIISNGGKISALGDSGGANVQIDTRYFIASSDRPNIVEVNGTLTFSNAIYDVSAGTTDVDLSMLDASSVLQGQCSSVHATGRVSQLNIPPAGPFGSIGWSSPPPPQPALPPPSGGCQ